MKKFEVEITETLFKRVTVLANSIEEAQRKAEQAYKDESIVLSASDFSDGSIVTNDPDSFEQLRWDF